MQVLTSPHSKIRNHFLNAFSTLTVLYLYQWFGFLPLIAVLLYVKTRNLSTSNILTWIYQFSGKIISIVVKEIHSPPLEQSREGEAENDFV
jgi:hypothetical protein